MVSIRNQAEGLGFRVSLGSCATSDSMCGPYGNMKIGITISRHKREKWNSARFNDIPPPWMPLEVSPKKIPQKTHTEYFFEKLLPDSYLTPLELNSNVNFIDLPNTLTVQIVKD